MAISGDVFAIVSESFNFDIEKAPLMRADGAPTPFYGLFRSDTNECVGRAVSQHYKPHTCSQVLDLVEAANDAFGGIASVDCHFDKGHHVSITPSREMRKTLFENDSVFPRVIINGAYDGKGFKASLGMFRDVCQNLMIMRSAGNAIHRSLRHSSSLQDRAKSLVDEFSSLLDSWAKVGDVADRMSQREVDLAEFITAVYGDPKDSKRGATMHENRTREIVARVIRERQLLGLPATDGKISAWEAYNAVQGYTQHSTGRKSTRTTDFARAVRAFSSLDVLRAERVALGLSV